VWLFAGINQSSRKTDVDICLAVMGQAAGGVAPQRSLAAPYETGVPPVGHAGRRAGLFAERGNGMALECKPSFVAGVGAAVDVTAQLPLQGHGDRARARLPSDSARLARHGSLASTLRSSSTSVLDSLSLSIYSAYGSPDTPACACCIESSPRRRQTVNLNSPVLQSSSPPVLAQQIS
jgi:hypothetical protein